MKRLISFVLCTVLSAGLIFSGCGKNEEAPAEEAPAEENKGEVIDAEVEEKKE